MGAKKLGRPPSTSHTELSHIAFELFTRNGYDETTVDDIAEAAGIGRRTFFRYFDSKNDLPWGEFDALLERMREFLAALPVDLSLMEALRVAVLEFNSVPVEEVSFHRQRMWLLLNVPSLVAHSTLRYAAWRQVVAEYVAARLGVAPEDMRPQVIASALLGICLAAYEQWLRHDDAELHELLDVSVRLLGEGIDGK